MNEVEKVKLFFIIFGLGDELWVFLGVSYQLAQIPILSSFMPGSIRIKYFYEYFTLYAAYFLLTHEID